MKDKAIGILIFIGVIMYMINSIVPYILIGLVVIVLIAIIVALATNKSAKSVNKEKTVYNKSARTQPIYTRTVARVSSSSIKSNSFVDDQKLIQSYVNAYNEVDNSFDSIKRMNKILRYCQRFYSKQAYTKRNLFSFIIDEANNAKQTAVSQRLIRECETIITEMLQLRNGVAIESIVCQYIENKKQADQLLIEQKTCNNHSKLKNLNSGSDDLKKNKIENSNTIIELKKPDPIAKEHIPLPVKKSNDNDREYELLLILTNAYLESDKTLDKSNLNIRLMNYIQMFYGKEAFRDKSLFDYIIKEANFTRSTFDRNLQQQDILECEIIVDDIVQLRNGVTVESIITKYSESKKQTIQQLNELETHLDCLETIHLTGDAQESIEEIDESSNSENNSLIKPIYSYQIRGSKQVIESASNEATICSDIPNYESEPFEPISEKLKKVFDNVPFWTHYYVYSASGIKTATQDQKDFYAFF